MDAIEALMEDIDDGEMKEKAQRHRAGVHGQSESADAVK